MGVDAATAECIVAMCYIILSCPPRAVMAGKKILLLLSINEKTNLLSRLLCITASRKQKPSCMMILDTIHALNQETTPMRY